MARTKALRKRCERCGRIAMVRPRVRRCQKVETRMGGAAYTCYGVLVLAPIHRTKDASGKLERKLVAAHERIEQAVKDMAAALRRTQKARTDIRRIERAIELRDNPPDPDAPKKQRRRKIPGARKYASLPDDVADTLAEIEETE